MWMADWFETGSFTLVHFSLQVNSDKENKSWKDFIWIPCLLLSHQSDILDFLLGGLKPWWFGLWEHGIRLWRTNYGSCRQNDPTVTFSKWSFLQLFYCRRVLPTDFWCISLIYQIHRSFIWIQRCREKLQKRHFPHTHFNQLHEYFYIGLLLRRRSLWCYTACYFQFKFLIPEHVCCLCSDTSGLQIHMSSCSLFLIFCVSQISREDEAEVGRSSSQFLACSLKVFFLSLNWRSSERALSLQSSDTMRQQIPEHVLFVFRRANTPGLQIRMSSCSLNRSEAHQAELLWGQRGQLSGSKLNQL